MFAAGDLHDLDGFTEYIADDFEFTFASNPTVTDPALWRARADAFHAVFPELDHHIAELYTPTDDIVVTVLKMGYKTVDGTTSSLPCCDIFRLNADSKVTEYRIFMDIAPALATVPGGNPHAAAH
jgi:ketosteroid isomerase-like protein